MSEIDYYLKAGIGPVELPEFNTISLSEYCQITGMASQTALKRIKEKRKLPAIIRLRKSCGTYLVMPHPDYDLKTYYDNLKNM